MSDAAPTRTAHSNVGPGRWAVAIPVAGALLLCLLPLFWPGHWSGVLGYDEGVHVGSAEELARGLLPYKDFAFLQPPGITIALLPMSLVARVLGLGSQDVLIFGRLLTLLVTAAGVGLAAFAVRHRGTVAMLVAGSVLAAYPIAYKADSATFLEPFMNLFCLLAVVLLVRDGRVVSGGRARPYLAGACIGLAVSFKLWALIFAAVAVVFCWRAARPQLPRLVAGIATAMLVVFGPFFAASPGPFVRDVLGAQANRITFAGVGMTRFTSILGTKYLGLPAAVAVAAALAWVALAVIVRWKSRGNERADDLDRLAGATALVVALALLFADPFYFHYSYVLAPWAGILTGTLVGRALSSRDRTVTATPSGGVPSRTRASVLVMSVVVATLTLGALVSVRELQVARRVDPAIHNDAVLRALSSLSPRSCIIADTVSLLVAANRLPDNLAKCPVLVDAYGIQLVNQAVHGTTPAASAALAAQWRTWFSKADYVFLSNGYERRIPWVASLDRWFRQQFVHVPLRTRLRVSGRLYRRRALPG